MSTELLSAKRCKSRQFTDRQERLAPAISPLGFEASFFMYRFLIYKHTHTSKYDKNADILTRRNILNETHYYVGCKRSVLSMRKTDPNFTAVVSSEKFWVL